MAALLVVLLWSLAIAFQLFIIFLFYSLLKRIAVAAERQTYAIERLELRFRAVERNEPIGND